MSDRKQRTVLDGQASTWGNVSAGVPQVSILGNLLFLIYINDLTNNWKWSMELFAEDTSLFMSVQNPNVAAIDMNHEVDHIALWAHDWRISFNPDPRKQAVELVFSRKTVETNQLVILFNAPFVSIVAQHKQLGIIVDFFLSSYANSYK